MRGRIFPAHLPPPSQLNEKNADDLVDLIRLSAAIVLESADMNDTTVELRAKYWKVAPLVSADVRHKLSGLHPAFVQLLYNRGFTNPAQIQAFLDNRYIESEDPFLLADMGVAIERIQHAIKKEETIIVYGDFDADGVTATVLLTEALRGMGASRLKAQPYIPDRVDEGYGLNEEAIRKLRLEKKADLVISVDCGIRSVAEVALANQLGLDMIITDHHHLGSEVPAALAVINPRRPDSAYPEKRLAGVGIAYKLAQALHSVSPHSDFDLSTLLDLVAIGTVADLAPLLGENRKLVVEGLKVLNTFQRAGIGAIAQKANLKQGQLSAETIGFTIGPRINAAGRLSHAYDAARLLAEQNLHAAMPLAESLEDLNRQRQKLTEQLGQYAESLIGESTDAPILIAADPQFLSGIVGLVASRLAEKHYRPTIVIEKGTEESRGSCRSIPEFHITEALDRVSQYLERYGGHAQAAGFTVLNKNLPNFIDGITEVAREMLHEKKLLPTINIDMELTFDQIDWAFYGLLEQLEPTGIENRRPIFMSRRVQLINYRTVGSDGNHLQLEVAMGQHGFKCIAFQQGSWAGRLPRLIDIVYSIGVNEWQGRRNLQLFVQDIRPTPSEETDVNLSTH